MGSQFRFPTPLRFTTPTSGSAYAPLTLTFSHATPAARQADITAPGFPGPCALYRMNAQHILPVPACPTPTCLDVLLRFCCLYHTALPAGTGTARLYLPRSPSMPSRLLPAGSPHHNLPVIPAHLGLPAHPQHTRLLPRLPIPSSYRLAASTTTSFPSRHACSCLDSPHTHYLPTWHAVPSISTPATIPTHTCLPKHYLPILYQHPALTISCPGLPFFPAVPFLPVEDLPATLPPHQCLGGVPLCHYSVVHCLISSPRRRRKPNNIVSWGSGPYLLEAKRVSWKKLLSPQMVTRI